MDKVKKLLTENYLDAALISSLPNIIYLTNFSHFTDMEREAFILITKSNEYIFTDARYSHAVKTHLPKFKLLEISTKFPFIKLLEEIIKKENLNNLGIEEDNITAREFKKISSLTKSIKHFDLNPIRIIKSKHEIEKIKKACNIGDQAFTHILKKIKSGMTEKQIAFEIDSFIRKNDCEPSFRTIIAFEENAAIPHHKSSDRKLNSNELILIDFGVNYENYCSDMTRTIFFGNVNNEKMKAYNVVKKAQEIAMMEINDSLHNKKIINATSIDNASRKYLISEGFPSFSHSLGHGIGLEVHEAPSLSIVSNNILTEGMAFSIEPGIYLPDKFGIRIEDLFTIKDNKLIKLTNSPTELIEIPHK